MGKNVFKLACAVLGTAALSSCTDYTIMDEEAIRNGLFGDEYSENFAKVYGKVGDTQTWDFSLVGLRSKGLEGGPSFYVTNPVTRRTDNCTGVIPGSTKGTGIASTGSSYTVPDQMLAWLNNKLGEGVRHTDLGSPFELVNSGQDFLIIPIYQGHSGMAWDLHLVAKNTSDELKDYMIWSKSDNMGYTKDFARPAVPGDVLQPGGEEVFHNMTSASDGGDVTKWDSKGNIKALKIARTYYNLRDQIESSNCTSFKVHMTIPAGGYISGKFGNVYASEGGWDFEFDNRSGLTAAVFTKDFIGADYDIRNKEDNEWPNADADAYWNFGIKDINYVKEGTDYSNKSLINIYASQRIHIFVEFNGTGITTTEQVSLQGQESFNQGHTVNRTGITTKPIRINSGMIKDDFFLYLDVTNGQGDINLANTGTKQRSDEGMMLALMDKDPSMKMFPVDYNVASSLEGYLGKSGTSGWEYFVVGAEDANLSASDWDINDVVFLIAAQNAPDIREYKKKRYMIEDLGSTYDFDFNDIVVDVTQKILTDVGTRTQTITSTANLAHLCGTIPFQLQIGDTTLPKVDGNNAGANEGDPGYEPAKDKDGGKYNDYINATVQNWNPETNNIKVTVWPNEAGVSTQDTDPHTYSNPNGSGVTYTFPTDGCKNPYIIAVDQSVGWTRESYAVPENWFNTWPAGFKWIHDQENSLVGGIDDTEKQNFYSIKWDEGYNIPVTTGVYCSMSADVLSVLEVRDKLTVFYKDNNNGTLKVISGNGFDSGDIALSDASGSVLIEVKAENIDQIKTGIAVTGNNFTLDRVRYVREKQISWGAGNYPMTTNAWYNYYTMPKAEFSSIAGGDKLIIDIDNLQSLAVPSLQYMKLEGGKWQAIENVDINRTNKTISVTLTADDAANLKEYGLAIMGMGFTIKNVKLTREVAFGENNFVMNNSYNSYCTMSAAKFANIEVDDEIFFRATSVGSSASAQLQIMGGANAWKPINGNTNNLSEGSSANFSLKITESIKSDLQNYGMAIMGQNYTLNRMEIRKYVTLDALYSGAATSDYTDHVLTFQNVAKNEEDGIAGTWSMRGWWFDTPLDGSKYSKFTVEYNNASESMTVRLCVSNGNGSSDSNNYVDAVPDTYYQQSVDINTTGGLQNLYLHSDTNGSITLQRAFLTKKP